MPRNGISVDDVSAAMHSLETTGVIPSVRLIRQTLGKGSLTTIAEHKRTVEAERSEADPTEALPDPISKALRKGADSLWRELVDAAQAEITAAQEEADARVAEAKADTDAARQETDAAHDALAVLQQTVEALEKTVVERDAQLSDADKKRQSLEQDLARLDEARASLSEERNDLKERMDRQLKESAQLSADIASLKGRLEIQATEHTNAQAACAEQTRKLEKTLNDQAVVLERERNHRHAAEQEVSRLTGELTTRQKQTKKLTSEIKHRESERDALADKNASLAKQNASLETELHTTERLHARITQDQNKLVDKLEASLQMANARLQNYDDEQRSILTALLEASRSSGSSTPPVDPAPDSR